MSSEITLPVEDPARINEEKAGEDRRRARINLVIESLRPTLQADRGDIELVDIVGDKIFVKMTGACVGCQLAAFTLHGVKQRICSELGEAVRVIPASQITKLRGR
ncbi:NifU family protein [Martelella endophytica]|uniref:NifU family protein n=1 Tax=Martelella endophytica TaxID=1486262 RepID=UPI000698A4C5|nr:NifU family protein [Martelella endophytica]